MIAAKVKKKKTKMNQYDQEMPQSQTADQPTAPLERDTEHRQPHHN